METNQQLMFNKILSTVAEYKASDLHFTVGSPPVIRIDTKLKTLEDEPVITPDFVENIVGSILTPNQQEILKRDKRIIIAYSFQNRARFRVSMFYQKGYLAISLRYIPEKVKSLKELGLPSVIEQFTETRKGLVIICGPFESGMTSTLAAIINEINNKRKEYILTIENPIEHLFTNNKSIIEQREIGRDTPSIEVALKDVTHEDINVVMVSELPNAEVIKEILDIAESGRVIYTSVDADSVTRAIEKIINSVSRDEQSQLRSNLAENLEGAVCQRLLPRVGGGRIPVVEVLIPTAPVRNIIKEGVVSQINNIIQTSREEGMISLDRSLAELVKTGEIQADVAAAYAKDIQSLKMMMRR